MCNEQLKNKGCVYLESDKGKGVVQNVLRIEFLWKNGLIWFFHKKVSHGIPRKQATQTKCLKIPSKSKTKRKQMCDEKI